MKVLHLLSSNSFSGAENVATIIIELFSQEHEMAYCSPRGPISEVVFDKGINYLPIKKLSCVHLKRVIKSFKPDLIHAHDIRASVISAITSPKIPIISHIHGKFDDMSKITIKSLLYMLCIKRFSHIIAVSNSIPQEYIFKKKILARCSVLYNVVDTQKIDKMIKQDNNEYTYDGVYIGRFSYPKNPERLIRIISKVVNDLPKSKFILIGDGVLLEKCKLLAENLKIQGNITFTGFIKNPYKILNSSKLMIMTSRSEGTPMCLLEAMCLGIPVVSTPVDGIKELIVNEVEGFYYERDEKIVESIKTLLLNNYVRQGVSRKIYEKSQIVNDIDVYKSHLLKIYEETFL